jgi:hypothetical protein
LIKTRFAGKLVDLLDKISLYFVHN